jgi:hypothetical protein
MCSCAKKGDNFLVIQENGDWHFSYQGNTDLTALILGYAQNLYFFCETIHGGC